MIRQSLMKWWWRNEQEASRRSPNDETTKQEQNRPSHSNENLTPCWFLNDYEPVKWWWMDAPIHPSYPSTHFHIVHSTSQQFLMRKSLVKHQDRGRQLFSSWESLDQAEASSFIERTTFEQEWKRSANRRCGLPKPRRTCKCSLIFWTWYIFS